MGDICMDNRFEMIEEFKKKLIESTNIETSPEEMEVIDNILFRFWQMGWLESIDRMSLVKESAKTLIHSVGNSVSAKVLRNAGRFMQNAIDGEAPEFELVQVSSEIPNSSDIISRQAAVAIASGYCHPANIAKELARLPSAQPEIIRCKDCKYWTHIKRTNRYWCKTDDGLFDLNPSPDDFCSRAERRTDETD